MGPVHVILKLWNSIDKTSSMYRYVKLNRDVNCFVPVENEKIIKSALNE